MGILDRISSLFTSNSQPEPTRQVTNQVTNTQTELTLPTCHIGFFGPSRVGKTTLLAAMCHEFAWISKMNSELYGTYLPANLVADNLSANKIKARRESIKAGIKQEYFQPGALQSTSNHEMFNLKLRGVEDKFCLPITFHDFPGGWLDDPVKEKELNYKNWDVFIIPIDSTMIMHSESQKQKSITNNMLNIAQVDESLRKWAMSRRGEPSLCFFVPIKCETYIMPELLEINLPNRYEELEEKIRETYSESIDFLQEEFAEHVGALYWPANTIGCCYLDMKKSQWTEDGLDGYFRISKAINKWQPFCAVHIILDICHFLAEDYNSFPENYKTKELKNFVKFSSLLSKAIDSFYN